MSEITTTSWLIGTLSGIQSKKLEYQSLITKLEAELEESDLVKRINKWKELLREINLQEIETKNQWLEILEKAWLDKFEANWIEVRKKISAWSLIIDDQDKIDAEYKEEVVKTTIKVDKKKIKADMKDWIVIDWVHLDQKVTLEIKYK